MIRKQDILLLLILANFSACSSVDVTHWSFPYYPKVQQGNYITHDMISELKLGMTKQQVITVMGGAKPLSQFVFDDNVWTYIYQLYQNDSLVDNWQLTIVFKQNKVVKIEDSKNTKKTRKEK